MHDVLETSTYFIILSIRKKGTYGNNGHSYKKKQTNEEKSQTDLFPSSENQAKMKMLMKNM